MINIKLSWFMSIKLKVENDYEIPYLDILMC